LLEAADLTLRDGTNAYQRFVVIAGRRGGKTLGGALCAVKEVRKPDTLGWCVAPSYPELNDFVMPTLLRVLPQAWLKPGRDGWSEKHQTFYLRNGSQIGMRYGDDPERMRGPGLHWIWFDECRNIPQKSWETVRPALTEHRGRAYFTTTPNGFDWVYKLLWRRAVPGGLQIPGWWGVRYRSIDNPSLPREEIEEARQTMDPLWFKQEYEAEFVSFQGAIYGAAFETCLCYDAEDLARIRTFRDAGRRGVPDVKAVADTQPAPLDQPTVQEN